MSSTDVLVIGAGPNGLSLAAFLDKAGVERRVVGCPMGSWRHHMPAGMILKSEPYASDLAAPEPGFRAGDYCRAVGDEYHDRVIPLTLAQFIAYGQWFTRHLVPDVEETQVVNLTRSDDGLLAGTSDGQAISARRVVVATGITAFAHLPAELAALPPSLVSHTSSHTDLSRFSGQEVIVVGRGASALETAALLHEGGADVRILVRGDQVRWPRINPQAPGRLRRLRRPVARLCEGWQCWGYDRFPDLFRLLPERTRLVRAFTFLGPAGAWWLRERVEGQIPLLLGQRLCNAEVVGERVRLTLDGERRSTVMADHVIAGTGFRFDLDRLPYLDAELRAAIKVGGGAPVLNRSFESSVPGLFFVGALAAPTFGPLMRFIAGTHFTAPRLAWRLSPVGRRPEPVPWGHFEAGWSGDSELAVSGRPSPAPSRPS